MTTDPTAKPPEKPGAPAGTILIVDDDPVCRQVLKGFLAQHRSYRFVEATDGAEAMRAVQRETPTAMFLDLGLPVIDGIDVLQTIRAHPLHRTLPVIVLSGSRDSVLVRRAIALGIEDYLVKPLRPSALEQRVFGALDAIAARSCEAGAKRS
jgi:CheY-like chemotaxis protein